MTLYSKMALKFILFFSLHVQAESIGIILSTVMKPCGIPLKCQALVGIGKSALSKTHVDPLDLLGY